MATALLLAGLSAPQWVSQITGSVAAADTTGTGGQFVPKQFRLADTRDGTGGYSTPMPDDTYRPFQVAGVGGIPASGVMAVMVTVTALNTTADAGVVAMYPNGTPPTGITAAFLVYGPNEPSSNSGMIEVAADGKIMVKIDHPGVNLLIDVQGYFLDGNGFPAPGGYVPVGPTQVYSNASRALGSTADIQVSGLAGVPSTATAVFANITVTHSSAGAVDGQLQSFPTNTTPSNTSLNFADGVTSIGTTLDLNAGGTTSLKVGSTNNGAAVAIQVDVYGYFDGQPSAAGYNTKQSRLFDSRNTPGSGIAPGDTATATVTVGGVNGMPAYSPSIAAFALNITAIQGTTGGSLTVFSSDDSAPSISSLTYDAGFTTNLVLVQPGTDNTIKIRNNGTATVEFVVDAEGWFTNTTLLPPAVGLATGTSGNRSGSQMMTRAIHDRMGAGVNPTNGNLLLTQQLMSLTGIGQSFTVGVRYNSLNDNRPTLSAGLFESQLFRKSDGTLVYTAADGGTYTFTNPTADPADGNRVIYAVPNDINAHLVRTTGGNVGIGATYELILHPSQQRLIYRNDGSNIKLIRSVDSTCDVATYPSGPTEAADTTDDCRNISYSYLNGRIRSITDTQGRVINFNYIASPNPTQPASITDTSLNRTVYLDYNGPSGALSKVTDATGKQTTWAYGTNGKVSSVTDDRGSVTAFEYFGSGRISKLTTGSGSTTPGVYTFGYPANQMTVTDGNSVTTTYTISGGRTITVTDMGGNASQSVWEPHGELKTFTDARNNPTNNTYDQAGAANLSYGLRKSQAPNSAGGTTGRTTEFTYPAAGGKGATADYRATQSKDSQGNTTAIQSNGWGQPLASAPGGGSGVGGTITNRYQDWAGVTCGGKRGQLCQSIDGKGNTTSYTYNSAGNLVTITPPAPLGAVTMVYDAAGRVAAKTDGKGQTANYCYDANDRLTQTSYTTSACASQSGVTTVYDAAGNAVTEISASGTRTVTFDSQNRPTVLDESTGGAVRDSSVIYDAGGRVTSYTDSAGTTSYRYNNQDEVEYLAEPGGSCAASPVFPNSTKCIGFEYDANHQRTITKLPTGVVTTNAYDNGHRMTSVATKTSGGATLVSRTYTWSTGTGSTGPDSGLIQKTVDQAGVSTTYGYDQMNRLKSATPSTGSAMTWVLDLNGNRTKQTVGSTVTNYGYNAADQLCWYGAGTGSSCTAPSGATALTYDGNGNQTSNGNSYNAYDQLTGTTAGGTQSYSYSGTNNTDRATAGNLGFTNGLIGLTRQSDGTTTTKFIRDPNGTLIAMQTASGSFYYTMDIVGSVILLSNSSQAAAATYTYDPFGKSLTATGTQAQNNPYRYATGYLDAATGLLKMGARYYNPDIGRFTQTDPSGQEANRYLYASANPISRNDPSGLDDCDYFDNGPPEDNTYDQCVEEREQESGVVEEEETSSSSSSLGYTDYLALAEGCASGAVLAYTSGVAEYVGLLTFGLGAAAVTAVSCAIGAAVDYAGGGTIH